MPMNFLLMRGRLIRFCPRGMSKLIGSTTGPAEVLPSNGLFDRFMEIPERGFYGQFRKWPNGRVAMSSRGGTQTTKVPTASTTMFD
jgi:hypothetical protein